MTDESTAREGVEQEARVPTTEQPDHETPAEAQAEPEGNAVEGLEAEGAEEAVEDVEFDFGGNKFKVKKGAIPDDIAAELDKFTKGTWSDYTKKSQANAEAAKSLQAREQAVEKMASLNGEMLATYSKGLQVKAEIEQLSQVDLSALWQSNPDQARRVSDRLSQQQAELQRIASDVSQKETAFTQAQQAEQARRAAENEALLERRIKGFAQKVPEIVDYVHSQYGIPKEHAASVWKLDPVTAELAHKAMLYDRMQAKAQKPATPAAATPVKPLPGGKGGRNPTNDLAKMSPREMARHLGLPG